MDGINLGVILRAPFKQEDEDFDLLQAMEPGRILLDATFGSFKRKQRRGKISAKKEKFYEELSKLLDVPTSIFVPLAHGGILETVASQTVFIECDENHGIDITTERVTKLLEERPDTKIGIVASLQAWLSSGITNELSNLLAISNQIFICPIIGNESPLSEQLEIVQNVLPNSVPFIQELSNDDTLKFPEILGRFSEDFTEFIFWTLGTTRGIDWKEVQMKRRKKVIVKVEEVAPVISDSTKYKALQPVALREAPSKNANCKGHCVVGETYSVVKTQKGSMDIGYGLLDTGFYVILSEGQSQYFEKL